MESIKNLLLLLEAHSNLIVALSIIIGGFWGIIKFREHIKDKRFKTYHELIDWLVNEQIQPDRKIKLDRQIAIVYELRNFPNYFDVSKRILKGLHEQWKDEDKRILNEIQLTLSYMERNWVVRLFKK
ncbi:MAG: hypothetical protein WC687_04870 [Patescibacteria group bacterium]|jgi:hypothetical protein